MQKYKLYPTIMFILLIFTFINYPNYLWKLTNNRGIMSTFALGFK